MIAPKGVVSGIKNADDATLNRLIKGGVHQLKGKQPKPHSPQALGQRVLGRELSKRGLGEQGVAEGLKFHGGFPDVDHMPGAVYRNGERPPGMRAQVGPPANYRNKAEWARAANRINSEAHDDNAEIISSQGVTKYMHDGKCFAKWVDSKNTGVVAGQPLSEADEGEGTTVKNSLHTIIRVATHLDKALANNDEFPEWVSEKIGSVKDQMVTVMDYEISDKELTENDLVLSPGKGRQYKPGLLSKPEVSVNPTDAVKVDIPLLIRLLEYAKEDAPDDMALHALAEKLVAGCSRGKTLTMSDYDLLVP